MEWHHFEYFKVLAETEHVSHSAEKLNVSQSALSRALKQIEQTVGVPLFDRYGRNIKLNQYGRDFLVVTERITQEMNAFKAHIDTVTSLEHGTITIGFLHTVGATYMSHFLQQFKTKYPNVKVQLVQNNAKILLEMIQEGIVDIGITSILHANDNTTYVPLITEELFITLTHRHRLAHESSIDMHDLKHEDFILLKEGFILRQHANRLFENYQIKPNISFEGDETQTIASFVDANLGISILPKMIHLQMSNLKQIPIKNEYVARTIGMCWRNEIFKTKLFHALQDELTIYFKHIEDHVTY